MVEFWFRFFKYVALVLATLILSIAGCVSNTHIQTRLLIESGKADPIAAACAMAQDGTETTVCVARIIAGAK